MKCRIKYSPYPECADGTIGEVIRKKDDGYVIRVDGNFTVAGATPTMKLGQRECYFEANQVEIIEEPRGTAAEIVFLQALEWLCRESHENAVAKGFWINRNAIVTACSTVSTELGKAARKAVDSQLRELIISEISEACEGDRKDLADDKCPQFSMVECELADALIRIADYVKARNLRVGLAVIAKMKYNAAREKLHGKQF